MHPLIRSIVGSKDKENRVPCSQVVYSPMGETSKHKLWVTIWPCKFNNRNVKKHSELLSCTWERESTWCTRTSAWPGRWRKFMQESVLDLKLESRKRREGFSWGKNVSNKVNGWEVEHVCRTMGCSSLLVTTFPSNKNVFGNQHSIFSFLQHPNGWRHAEPYQNSCILLGCIVYV